MAKTLIALSVTQPLLLGACSMAPDYQRPELPRGASWQDNLATKESLPLAPAVPGPGPADADPARHWTTTGICASRPSTSRPMRRNTGSSGRPSCRPWPPAALAPASGIRRSQRRGQGTISSQYGADIGITAYELDLFCPDPEPQRSGPGELPGASRDPAQHPDRADRLGGERLHFTLLADQELLALSQATLATEQESYAPDPAQAPAGAASEMELAQGARRSRTPGSVGAIPAPGETGQKRPGLLLGTEVPVLATQPATLAEVKLAPIPVGHLQPAAAAPGHPGGGAQPEGSQRQYRRGPRRLLPDHLSLTATAGTASNQLSGLF